MQGPLEIASPNVNEVTHSTTADTLLSSDGSATWYGTVRNGFATSAN